MHREQPGPLPERIPARRALAAYLVLAWAIGSGVAAGAEPPRVVGPFTVTTAPDFVDVTYKGDSFWRAVVDRKRGGAVRHFSLGDDAPNLVAVDDKAEGTPNPFRGMFNLFYMTRIEKGDKPDDRVKAKGTIWKYTHDSASLRVVSHDDDGVVIEAKGRGFGWRLIGPDTEAVVDYRQTYTFRGDRVVCDGELTWVYPHETRLSEMTLESFLAPSVVAYPLRVIDSAGRVTELPLSSSKGHPFPEGVAYPLTLEVSLRNGYRLRFRTLQLPSVIEKTREYFIERPWQQDWAQAIGFIGDSEQIREPFPPGAPVHYRYEMLVDRPPPDRMPPRLTIISPDRESFCRPGETLRFSAAATDAEGRPISDDKIQWEVYYPPMQPARQQAGKSLSYVIPAEGVGPKGSVLVAAATVTDDSGRSAREYVKVNVEIKAASAPAAGKSSSPIGVEANGSGRITPRTERR